MGTERAEVQGGGHGAPEQQTVGHQEVLELTTLWDLGNLSEESY